METLDELCAKCKCLREEEFNLLLSALRQEEERRKNAERNEDWQALCKQIDHFTAKWGCITVFDNEGCVGVMNLRRGGYAFTDFGEIEVY